MKDYLTKQTKAYLEEQRRFVQPSHAIQKDSLEGRAISQERTNVVKEIIDGLFICYSDFPLGASREEIIDVIVKLPFMIKHSKPFYSCQK